MWVRFALSKELFVLSVKKTTILAKLVLTHIREGMFTSILKLDNY